MTFLITWYFSFNKIFWLMLNRTHEIRFYKFFLKILYIGFLMIFVMFEIVYSIFAINGLTCKVKSFDFPYNRSTWYFVSINGVGSKLKVGAGGWARLIRNLQNCFGAKAASYEYNYMFVIMWLARILKFYRGWGVGVGQI